MTTKVTIKNHGPDRVKVETLNPDNGTVNQTLHLLTDGESMEDLYVYDGHYHPPKMSEKKCAPTWSEAKRSVMSLGAVVLYLMDAFMSWIKGFGVPLKVAVLAGLAAMAVMSSRRQKAIAEKWIKRADSEKEADVQAGTRKAQQYFTQAKLHENKAAQAKEAATKKIDAIGRSDETLAEIVAAWGTD